MITKNYVDDVREEFSHLYKNDVFQIDKSGVKVLEIRGVSFEADEPEIFGKLDPDYAEREVSWYTSQSTDVNDFPGGAPQIWRDVADKLGHVVSNYGYRIWGGSNQYRSVIEELKKNINSRRAVMIYTEPAMWNLYDVGGRSDFICTNCVQYIVRYGVVHAVVQMRSNDAVFGFANDLHWQRYVLKMVADELVLAPGKITWQVGSFHVYERHFYSVHHYGKTSEHNITKSGFRETYPKIAYMAPAKLDCNRTGKRDGQ